MLFHYINNFNNFYNFFIGLSLGILLNDFFERKYPNEFKNFRKLTIEKFVNFSYNCIYYYSKCQIFFMNIKNKLILFIEANPILLTIRNNLNIYSNKYEKNIEYYNDYGFNIFNYVDNNIVNKLIFYKNSNHPTNEKSDIKFMLIEFKNGENIYKIDLKTDTFNYYFVGNKFTKSFFIFYVKMYLNKKNEFSDDNNYTLKFIDHDVNKIEIDFTNNNESILLEKNGYKLINDDDDGEKE